MATWAPTEVAVLFQAWREAIDTPMHERSKISSELFRRFKILLGNETVRTDGAVSFKQGSLKNMVQLVSAFSDHDRWFAFSLEQKKRWFKLVNRRSYKFIDIDRAMFDAVAELIRLQDESPNVRSRAVAGSGRDAAPSTLLRVRLRRNSVDGEWQAQPDFAPEQWPESADMDAVVHAASGAPSSELPLQRSTRAAPGPAKGGAVAPASRDFRSLLAPGANDTRSIFAPASPKSSQAVKAPASPSAVPQRESPVSTARRLPATSQPPSRRRDAFELDMESDDSDSSADSDSDDEMRDASRVVAAQLQSLESMGSGLLGAASKRDAAHRHMASSVASRRSAALATTLLLGATQAKHKTTAGLGGRHNVLSTSSALPATRSKETESTGKHYTNPELVAIASILETQTQELKQLLAAAKAERALDLQHRANDAEEKRARDAEIRELVEAVKRDCERRHGGAAVEDERRQLAAEIERLRTERQLLEQARAENTAARSRVLEQIALDREERRKLEEALALDRAERQALWSALQQGSDGGGAGGDSSTTKRRRDDHRSGGASGGGEHGARLSALSLAAVSVSGDRGREVPSVEEQENAAPVSDEAARASRDDSRDRSGARLTRSSEQPKKHMKIRRS